MFTSSARTAEEEFPEDSPRRSISRLDMRKMKKFINSLVSRHELYGWIKTYREICVDRALIVQDPADEPEEYLKLTKICMERAQKITSPTSSLLRFNYQQCKYLADKLKLAVKSADSFLELIRKKCLWIPSREDRAYCLKIFEQLYASAKEVEDFIQSHCSKDAWIHAAMLLTNVSEYVSAIGFDLELWRLVFSKCENLGVRRTFTLTDVDAVFKAEVGNVKGKAWGDREMLLRHVNAVLRMERETSAEFQLAALLLERLEGSIGLIPADDLSPKSSIISDTVYSRMERLGEVVFSSLKRGDQLGKGSAAVVYKATWLGGEVALKTFDGPDNNDFNNEVSMLRGLSHPNIISLLCSKTNGRGMCSIVVELMGGDLRWLMQERISEAQLEDGGNPDEPPFDIMEAVDLMLQVGRGMHYLHEKKIVHRDLKSMNILVRRVKKHNGIEYVVAKVADFGLSKTKESTKTYSNQTLGMGTTRWMAPEMIKSCARESEQASMSESKDKVLKYPFKTDIYSFGMVCFEILTGDVPFSTMNPREIKKLVLNDGRPTLPDQCPLLLKRLIKRCWSADPRKRPGFGEICAELRHLKCLLLMPSALGEVKTALSVNIPERVTASSTSNSSTPIGFKRRGRHVEWLVALDLGTIYSGFAYAKVSNVDQMCVNNDYPYYYGQWTPRGSNSSGRENLAELEKPYCKTLTAAFYPRGLSRPGHPVDRPSWGYHAQHEYLANVEGLYLTELKSRASLRKLRNGLPSWAARKPLTVKSIITEYLKYIGDLALKAIEARENEAASFDRDSVLWCVSVPLIWDENAKQQIRTCIVNAGLVSSEGTAESIMLVGEPEAASFHCHQLLMSDSSLDIVSSLHARDKVMVVDVGGKTVDVVVQEVIQTGSNFKVKEVTAPSIGPCGGTSVDESFMKFLSRRIGCLKEFLIQEDRYRWRLLMEWEVVKCGFGHGTDTMNITLHNILLPAKWEAYEAERGYPRRSSYSTIELTQQDLQSIFDPVVENILGLIDTQLNQVTDSQLKVMFVVGGFAGSPYVMERIRARFSREVGHIYRPADPGSAIMQGAIGLALTPDAIAQAVTPGAVVPRILTRTYGIAELLPFEHGVEHRFVPIFKEDRNVEGKQVVKLGTFDLPHRRGQTQIPLELYSSSEPEPRHTEQGAGKPSRGKIIDAKSQQKPAAVGLNLFKLARVTTEDAIRAAARARAKSSILLPNRPGTELANVDSESGSFQSSSGSEIRLAESRRGRRKRNLPGLPRELWSKTKQDRISPLGEDADTPNLDSSLESLPPLPPEPRSPYRDGDPRASFPPPAPASRFNRPEDSLTQPSSSAEVMRVSVNSDGYEASCGESGDDTSDAVGLSESWTQESWKKATRAEGTQAQNNKPWVASFNVQDVQGSPGGQPVSSGSRVEANVLKANRELQRARLHSLSPTVYEDSPMPSDFVTDDATTRAGETPDRGTSSYFYHVPEPANRRTVPGSGPSRLAPGDP